MRTESLPAELLLRCAVAGLALASIAGCSGATSLPMEDLPVVTQRTSLRTTEGTATVPSAVAIRAAYSAPNPQRSNPFAYGGEFADVDLDTSQTKLSSTIVLGFARTDMQRVILSVYGRTHTLAVGESVGPICVAEIVPPLVTLRSGNSTWTASMFDSTSKH